MPSASNKPARDFHPRLIVLQIIALQCYHYIVLSFLYILSHLLTATPLTLTLLFAPLSMTSVTSWMSGLTHVLGYLGTSTGLVLVIEKSKKCLDFAVTVFLVHFCFCCIHSGFPNTWEWWVFNVFGVICCVCLGEYMCSWREMKEIPSLLG
ncbi:hypothetical protein TrVE_jg4897 [Triparma verrucosa]|uniref:Uncharacterized protein n=1 Tax=Triparma verrucosa TaxID=1606542 RepID=A0A9W7EXT0_9STRA|nr:hypothetical protein TrVE_jg4897 [Triparma verrucosa]